MDNSNNRFIIIKRKVLWKSEQCERYVIYEKPIFKFFKCNTHSLMFIKSYKSLRSARIYITKNNDNLYRISKYKIPN
jgi:hypothetical protein